MVKEMCWLPAFGNDGDKILHLKTKPNQPWKPYTAYPEFAAPDYKMIEGSKGWATFQKLKQEQWTLIPTNRALQERPFSNPDLDQRLAS